jgi:hypothetical protein
MNIEIKKKPQFWFYNRLYKSFKFASDFFEKKKKKCESKTAIFTKIQFVNINLILVEFKIDQDRFFCTIETFNKELYVSLQQKNWIEIEAELTKNQKDHLMQVIHIALNLKKWSKKQS